MCRLEIVSSADEICNEGGDFFRRSAEVHFARADGGIGHAAVGGAGLCECDASTGAYCIQRRASVSGME